MKIKFQFPRMVNDEENERVSRVMSKEELYYVVNTLKKDKSLDPNGWREEF